MSESYYQNQTGRGFSEDRTARNWRDPPSSQPTLKIVSLSQLENYSSGRCGIIPYTVAVSKTTSVSYVNFLFAVDSKSQQLCDFGGCIQENETLLEGGIREFHEESNKIITLNKKILSQCVAVYSNRTPSPRAYIFYPIDVDVFYNIPEIFSREHKKIMSKEVVDRCYTEVDRIEIVTQRNLRDLYLKRQNSTIWGSIKKDFELLPPDFIDILRQAHVDTHKK